MSLFLLLVSIFGNLWIVRIAQISPIHFFVVVAASVALIKKSTLFIVVSFLALVSLQLVNFEPANLTGFSNDEIRVRDERLSIYPSDYLQLGYYYEQKPEVVAIERIASNLIRQFDLNLYFFAGHPRERIGVTEFEKYPYILFPIFLLGLYSAIKSKRIVLCLFAVPVALAALSKAHDVFALFPFFTAVIYMGLVQLTKLVENHKFKNYIYVFFAISYLLVMLQIISYEIY